MSNYNPDDPLTLGPQWFPTQDDAVFVDSDTKVIGMALDAVTNDSIKQFWTMVCGVFGATDALAGGLIIEVLDITSGLPALAPNTEATYYPSSDVFVGNPPFVGGSWGPFSGGLPVSGLDTYWRAINSVTLTPGIWPNSGQAVANNAFVFNLFGNGYDFACRFAGVTGTMAGRWITGVKAHATVANYWAYDRPGQPVLRPYLYINSRKFFGPTVAVGDFGSVDFTWPINPSTGLPWTPGDIDRFDTAAGPGSSYSIGWVSQPTGSANNILALMQGQLRILSSSTDPRVSMGGLTSLSKQGWQEFVLRAVTDATPASLGLIAGHKYLFMVRRWTNDPGANLSIALCATEQPNVFLPGPPNWTSFPTITIDAATFRPTQLGDESGQVFGVALVKDDDSVSLDSQPYVTTSPLDGPDAWPDIPGGGEFFDNAPVNVDRSMKQGFTTSAGDEYGWVQIMVAQVSSLSDGDLTIRIKTVAGDVQQGSDLVITSSDLAPPRHRWQKIGKRIPVAPTLAPATNYYFEITSTASAAQGWLVQVLNSGIEPPPKGPPNGSSVATYGGATDHLTLIVSAVPTDYDDMDAEVAVSTLPPIPDDFGAAPVGVACCVNPVRLSWTPNLAIPGGFAAYELQRFVNRLQVWQTFARITDVNVAFALDYHAPNNQATDYRMRVIRPDGASSDWTNTATATPTTPGCVGLTFTSNISPELTVFYQDAVAQRVVTFPENIDVFQPQGRDGVVVNRELEDRLDRWKSTLRVRDGRVPCLPHGCDDFDALGRAVFDPLLNIARAGLPFVCVKNEAGDVWYGYLTANEGDWEQHGIEVEGGYAAYTADVAFTEETRVDFPFDQIAGS